MKRSQVQKQLARLLALVPYLIANPGVTYDEVCSAFSLDPATLDADLDMLWMCGVPPYDPFALIDVERDDDRITVTSADYFRRPVSLTVAEARALLSALAILGDLGPEGSSLQRLVDKVGAALGGLAPHESIGFVTDATGDSGAFGLLKDAIDRRRTVDILYYSASRDAKSSRHIDPCRLVNVGGHWYVAAHCHSAGAVRLFRLDRIETASLTGDTFDALDLPDLGSYEDGILYHPSPSDRVAQVRFSPRAARWAAEVWPDSDSGRHEDGSVTLSIPYAHETWLVKQLLPYGLDAKIIEPVELVTAFVTALSELEGRYRACDEQ